MQLSAHVGGKLCNGQFAGGKVALVTLPGVNYCGNNCLSRFQVTHVAYK